jgi:hypothetical protein
MKSPTINDFSIDGVGMEKASKRNILIRMTVMSANSPALIHSLSVDFFFAFFLSLPWLPFVSPVVMVCGFSSTDFTFPGFYRFRDFRLFCAFLAAILFFIEKPMMVAAMSPRNILK